MVGYFIKERPLFLKLIIRLLLLIILFVPVLVNAQHSIDSEMPLPDEKMDFFLMIILLSAMLLMVAMLGLTIFTIIIFLVILLGMIAAGVVVSSVFVSIYKKSWTAGFKTAWYIIVVLLASFTAMAGFGISSYLFNLDASKPAILIAGLLTGLLGGTFIAWVSIKFLRYLIQYVQRKFTSSIISNSTTDLDNQ